jgi:dodecin
MERTYKKIEIVGISETSFREATQNVVAKACQSLRHVDWFEVTEMRGLVEKDKVKEFQTPLRSAFGWKVNRLEQQMTKPGNNVRNRASTDRPFGRSLRPFRRPGSPITAIRCKWLQKVPFIWRPGCGTTVAGQLV